jgi:hypothetical protein
MEDESMENMGEKSKSVENKLAIDQSIKKMFFHLIGPLISSISHLLCLVYQGVDFGVD